MSFDRLGLRPELLRAVAEQGYTEPTPVQAAAIPLVLAGRDLLAGAQTGTGKTAAFVLPMLQLLDASRPPGPRRVRALVVTPTRELALQVEESVRIYGAHLPIRSVAIYGGVGMDAQVRALRAGAEIVVATPGRLLDHQGQGTIRLGGVEILVLDEADRMLDMGFIHDIRKVLALLPTDRQSLLFSATFSQDIRVLAQRLLRDPASVDVAPRNAPTELVRQVVHPVDKLHKRALLSHLVRSGQIEQALVFARTKHGANRLAEQLVRDGIDAMAIHGNKSQGARVRALNAFKDGGAKVLVATDIAARGIDIDQLPHVVNYELPNVPEDYIHRIGRTGRAGAGGTAVSLVSPDEAPLLRDIEKLLRGPIPREIVEGFTPEPGSELRVAAEARAFAELRSRPDARGGAPSRRGPSGGAGRPVASVGSRPAGTGGRGDARPGGTRSDGGVPDGGVRGRGAPSAAPRASGGPRPAGSSVGSSVGRGPGDGGGRPAGSAGRGASQGGQRAPASAGRGAPHGGQRPSSGPRPVSGQGGDGHRRGAPRPAGSSVGQRPAATPTQLPGERLNPRAGRPSSSGQPGPDRR